MLLAAEVQQRDNVAGNAAIDCFDLFSSVAFNSVQQQQ